MNNVVVFKKIFSANFDGFEVKSESISTLLMKLLESSSTTSVAKLNESLTLYFLVVNGGGYRRLSGKDMDRTQLRSSEN